MNMKNSGSTYLAIYETGNQDLVNFVSFFNINEGLVLLKLACIVNTDSCYVEVFVHQAEIPQPKRNHCILASDKNIPETLPDRKSSSALRLLSLVNFFMYLWESDTNVGLHVLHR